MSAFDCLAPYHLLIIVELLALAAAVSKSRFMRPLRVTVKSRGEGGRGGQGARKGATGAPAAPKILARPVDMYPTQSHQAVRARPWLVGWLAGGKGLNIRGEGCRDHGRRRYRHCMPPPHNNHHHHHPANYISHMRAPFRLPCFVCNVWSRLLTTSSIASPWSREIPLADSMIGINLGAVGTAMAYHTCHRYH